jgi:hypothetical protein
VNAPARSSAPAAWVEEGQVFARRLNHHTWQLGDWLIVGMAWDANFVMAARITGYAKSHLFNIRRVAMAWPPAERSYNISFTTYLHLLREKDDATRRLLVAKAIRERWTPESAVAYFAGRRAGTVGPPEPEPELAVPDVIAPAAPMVPTPAPPELPKPRAPRVRKTGGRPGRPPTRKVKCPHCGEVFPLYGHEVPRGDPDA